MGSIKRIRELSDIAPQYIAKSGLNSASELDTSKWGSIKIQHVAGLNSASEEKSRFPKLDECAHFHYEHVEIGPLQVSIADDGNLKPFSIESEEDKWWSLSIESQGKTWLMRRSYDNFRMLDQQLHRCIYDRKFSELIELPAECVADKENIHKLLSDYMKRFSVIAGNLINCGPILNWLELDNRGHRLLVPDDNCPINTPAVAAAYSVKRYIAQAPDEISFEVGDMISVIDMPPPEESIWWHGKKGFQVGFFPCECVAVIGDKVPRTLQFSSLSLQPTKPVLRKHGKLIAFFRSFILSRPSRRRLKQSGILKERVFGCDLGEHLLNSGHEIPMILKCCVEFIESYGLVDGIYRLSGVTSNIQKLRNAFDEDRVPALYEDEAILQDVHSVASLLKMYFRELPNPLCTYQLYHQFVGAVQTSQGDDTRLLKMRDVVQKLPPPHYRTLEYLMRHLARVSEKGHETGMTPRNIAIVWAPNLLRCKELEIGGVAALQGVGVQAVVTEFLICYAELIFCDRLPNFSLPMQQVSTKKCRPKSLAISTPTKLLSLEEARNRALLQASGKSDQGYIDVGGGPSNLPAKYHTVIELPGYSRKRMNSKRSPLGWKLLFGRSGRTSQRKTTENKASVTTEITIPGKALTEMDLAQSRRHLRPAKSAESLSSGLNSEAFDIREPVTRGGKKSNVEDTLSSLLLKNCEGKSNGHNRSVSHESYFDQLQDPKENLDISEIEVNFDLEESEMKIFSEDETIMSNGSGSLASNDSPRIHRCQKLGKGSSVKRLSHPKLLNTEDKYDNTQNADPSPKKQKTNDQDPPKSKLEEQLSNSVGDIQFIDSTSPDQSQGQTEMHPIQSPSPVSSISQISSSVLIPSSPILPHISHLMKSISDKMEPFCANALSASDAQDNQAFSSKIYVSDEDSMISIMQYDRPHSTILPDINSHYLVNSTEILEEVNISDKESLKSSELTTPDTPNCSTYTPLLDFDVSSLSNDTTPEVELNKNIKKSSSENLSETVLNHRVKFDGGVGIEKGNEKPEFCENITCDEEISGLASRPYRENITPEMVKIETLKPKSVPPKPEERKPKPIHPYVNIPFVNPMLEVGKILETSFDGEPITYSRSLDLSTIMYEKMSTESSSDSLINFNMNKVENLLDSLKTEESQKFEIKESEDICPDSCTSNFFKDSKEISEDEEKSGVENFSDHNVKEQSLSEMLINDLSDEKINSSWVLNDETQMREIHLDPSECIPVGNDTVLMVSCEKNESFEKQNISTNESDSNSSKEASIFINEEGSADNNVRERLVNAPEIIDKNNMEDIIFKKVIGEINEKTKEESDEEKSQSSEELFKCNNKTLNHLSNFKNVKGLLETDLDMPVEDLESENFTESEISEVKTTEEVSMAENVFFSEEVSLNSSVREILSKFESKSVKDSSEREQIELEGKDGELESISDKMIVQKIIKEKNLERPKTLERLSTKRIAEKNSDAESIRKVQLGKSKSGSQINEGSSDAEKLDVLLGFDLDFSDPQRRERIEKYKEKRRSYLREKYRPDSLKNEKDDFVLKIKQKHLRRTEWGEVGDLKEESSICESPETRNSGKTEEIQISPRFWKTQDPILKESCRRWTGAEDSNISQPNHSVSLRKDHNPKVCHDGSGNKSERKSLPEQKGVRGSPKKSHFLNFSLNRSLREDNSGSETSFKKQSSPTCGMTQPQNPAYLTDARGRTDDSLDTNSQAPLICIKDMAAMFEERVNDANTAKQYLSSV